MAARLAAIAVGAFAVGSLARVLCLMLFGR